MDKAFNTVEFFVHHAAVEQALWRIVTRIARARARAGAGVRLLYGFGRKGVAQVEVGVSTPSRPSLLSEGQRPGASHLPRLTSRQVYPDHSRHHRPSVGSDRNLS